MRLSFRSATGLLVSAAACGLLAVYRCASRAGAELREAVAETAGGRPGDLAAAPRDAEEASARPAAPRGADAPPGGAALDAADRPGAGAWRGAAVLPLPEFPRAKKPLFYLKHLTKAGGTFGQFLVQTVVAPDRWRVNADDGELRLNEKKSHFIAITMRNPCDLYVSFGNFCPHKAFNYGGPTRGPDPVMGIGDLPDEDFEAWFRNSQRMDGTGFYSFYFWPAPPCRRRARGRRSSTLAAATGTSGAPRTSRTPWTARATAPTGATTSPG
ncbi:unnamed protein product [Prorocentrum cordatum]|uniref:Uncharacterized protein n=1 Tax=Prorocentrum cordatum TaxID=2364126 RepID=A0ABN9WV58_9DINO|nr:unnamed protein product [Polarella glacialis]